MNCKGYTVVFNSVGGVEVETDEAFDFAGQMPRRSKRGSDVHRGQADEQWPKRNSRLVEGTEGMGVVLNALRPLLETTAETEGNIVEDVCVPICELTVAGNLRFASTERASLTDSGSRQEVALMRNTVIGQTVVVVRDTSGESQLPGTWWRYTPPPRELP